MQELVIPIVYDVGKDMVVNEIHLTPTSHMVEVIGSFKGASTILRISRSHDPTSFIVWVELYAMDLPDDIPELGLANCERRSGNDALRFLLSDRSLFVGGNFSDITGSDSLKAALETVFSRCREAFAAFDSGGAPAVTQIMDVLDTTTPDSGVMIN